MTQPDEPFLILSGCSDLDTRQQIAEQLSRDNWPFPVSCGTALPVRKTPRVHKSKAQWLDEQGFEEALV